MSNQLTALDATFLELEEVDGSAHMHIGGVLVFEPGPGGGAPPVEDLLAVFSYDGRLFFCFNADPESVPELDWVARSTRAAIDELAAAARGGEN